jgi:hypothetical protein
MVDITFGRGRGKISAVVDIAVGGVSLAIVETRGGTSTALASGHSVLSTEARTKKQAIGVLAEQLKQAGDLALKAYADHKHKAPIEIIYAVVHAPWVHSQAVHTSKRFDEDPLIEEPVIEALAKEAFAMASEIDTQNVFEANVMRIEVNGYRTRNPEGTRAHQLDVVSLVSDCDSEVKKAATNALGSLFPVAKIAWRSGARAIAEFVDNTRLQSTDVLIVDMSVDTTHIISMRHGLLEQSIVPEGVGTILARIAGGRMPEESLGHIRMLNREACSNEACEAVEKAMASAEPELARIFGEAIGKMAALRHVPNDLVLITHQDLEAWLGRFFTRIDFTQFTITTLPFEVHTPGSLGISSNIVGEHLDPALAVDTALVNIEARS